MIYDFMNIKIMKNSPGFYSYKLYSKNFPDNPY